MVERTLPNLGLNNRWVPGSSGWNTDMDLDLQLIDTTVFLAVLSATTITPPTSPTQGDRYIVPATGATGAWASNGGALAAWIDGGWVFYGAKTGWRAWVEDISEDYLYSSGAWVQIAKPYDIPVFRYLVPSMPEPVISIQIVRAFTLPVNLTGSAASLITAPGAAQSFAIKHNGSTVGSVNFAASATAGTFTFSAGVNFAAGDTFELDPPGSVDATMRGLRVTFAGLR